MGASSIFSGASGLGIGLGLGGIAGGLLGIGRQGYGQADQLYDQGQQLEDQVSGIGNQLGSVGTSQLGTFNDFEGPYEQSISNYGNYLNTNPYATDQGQMGLIGQGLGQIDRGTQGAAAQLTSQLAQRGFTGESSMLGGGLSSIYGNAASQKAGLQFQGLQMADQRQQQNYQAQNALYGGATATAYQRARDALGSQASYLGDNANYDANQANFYAQQTNAFNQGLQDDYKNMVGFGGDLAKPK
jgi:hypothetical protein